MAIHLATIEYGSDDGTEPDVILATTRHAMMAGIRDRLANFDFEGHDSETYVAECPLPADYSTDQPSTDMTEWLEGLHEAATVPWVTILPTIIDGLPATGYVLR